jgi:hypothetical protein
MGLDAAAYGPAALIEIGVGRRINCVYEYSEVVLDFCPSAAASYVP